MPCSIPHMVSSLLIALFWWLRALAFIPAFAYAQNLFEPMLTPTALCIWYRSSYATSR